MEYENNVIDFSTTVVEGGTKCQYSFTAPRPERPNTPLSMAQRATHVHQHLQKVLAIEHPRLSLDCVYTFNPKGTCRFLEGGDITIWFRQGAVVIGKTDRGVYENDSPDVKGDAVTSCNVEAKLQTNVQSLVDIETQLVANMHLSASHTIAQGLLSGQINPKRL